MTIGTEMVTRHNIIHTIKDDTSGLRPYDDRTDLRPQGDKSQICWAKHHNIYVRCLTLILIYYVTDYMLNIFH